MPLSVLTDLQLVERIQDMARSCQRIMEMPAEKRKTPSPKGTSPEQFGAVQAFMVSALWIEAKRRGLTEEDL